METSNIINFKKNHENEVDFFDLVGSIEGKFCQVVFLGEGTGSFVSFKFGTKRLNIDLTQPYTKEIRRYKADFSVFIQEASWRLEQYDKIICGTYSPNDNNGLMVKTMESLSGKIVLQIQVHKPSLDLEIDFEDGYKLKVFTLVFIDEDYDNYSISSADALFYVPTSGKLVRDR